jgi:hypothetical protein
MPTILDTRPCGCCKRGVNVYVQPDDAVGPSLPCIELHYADGKVPDKATLDAYLAARRAEEAVAAKKAEIDAALNAELEKRKATVDYSKDSTAALTTVFPTAELGVKV